MSESSAPSPKAERLLDAALGVLDQVDQDLADIQAEEAVVWRVGTVALLACGVALLSVTALAVLALLLRKLRESTASA